RALALLGEMREAKVEPDVISYSAGISACEKSEQWPRALALLCEMRAAKLEPDVTLSYSAGISACEKGEQWQQSLALLIEMRAVKVELDVICTTASALELGPARGSVGSHAFRCLSGGEPFSVLVRTMRPVLRISRLDLDRKGHSLFMCHSSFQHHGC
ncbi:unnamed protein product, partial [Prorocentrum cordatum]